ncbi:MAG: hypothetical protein Q8R36_01645 [bacterium]|nr:hypothetical protein [bacterium]
MKESIQKRKKNARIGLHRYTIFVDKPINKVYHLSRNRRYVMETETVPVLSLDSVNELLWSGEPIAEIADHRVCATLLFDRYNDNTRRFLIIGFHTSPQCVIEWISRGEISRQKTIPVASSVITTLLSEMLVEKYPDLIYGRQLLRLTRAGRRAVVENFCSGSKIHDYLWAGATISTDEGMRWT